jgi:hypothetical protein
MSECPRYLTCSAPVCPLDPIWKRRKHLPGERVCIWLSELAKPGGPQILEQELAADAAQDITQRAPLISVKFSLIRRALERAARSGSRVEADRRNLGRLRRTAGPAEG